MSFVGAALEKGIMSHVACPFTPVSNSPDPVTSVMPSSFGFPGFYKISHILVVDVNI